MRSPVAGGQRTMLPMPGPSERRSPGGPVNSKERQPACMMTVPERLVGVKSQHSNAFRWYVTKSGVTRFTSRQNIGALIKRLLEDDTCRKWRKISSAFKRGNAAVEAPVSGLRLGRPC
jgi:hypothetical protein